MKKIYLAAVLCLGAITQSFSQCSEVPVVEAVRNGDFEAGYLTGTGTTHDKTAGGPLDFYSDMLFAGNVPAKGAGCNYGMGDKYVVAKAETFFCGGTNHVDNTYWGIDYGGDKNFKDHTTAAGDGYALLVDLYGRTTSPKTGGKPIAWEQTMSIYPNESYWFSAYIANFANGTAPIMQVTLTPRSGGVDDIANRVILPVNGSPTGLMNWTQMSASWTPVGIYDEVTISFEFVNTQGASNGIDVAIDDISFINSCQNISSQNTYTADFNLPDTVNLCEVGGDQLLDPQVPVGQRGNAAIAWYEGTGNPQTEIDNGVWTKTVNQTGTYRVCIDDPDNGCPVSDVVTIIEEYDLEIPDITLCSPAEVALDAGIDIPNGAMSSIAWSGPSGNSSTRNYTVTTEGAHSVVVTAAGGHPGCAASDNFNVVSLLPEPDTIDYCDGGDVDIQLTVGDGIDYKWAEDQGMTNVIGVGNPLTYSVPNGITGFQELWIQNAETTPIGTFGPNTGGFSADGASGDFTSLTINQTVLLKSVSAKVPNWAAPANRSVVIQKVGGGSTTYGPFSIGGSATALPLDAVLTPGDYEIKVTGGAVQTTAVWSGTASTYDLNPYANITGYSAHYGPFGSFVLEESSACDPVPVVLRPITCCVAPTDDPIIDVASSTLEVCEPDNGEVHSQALTNGLDFKWEISTDGSTWSDYAGTDATGDVAGGKLVLPDVDTEQWYRFVIAEDGNLGKTCVKISDSVQFIQNSLPSLDSIGLNPYQSSYCDGDAYELEAHVDESAGYAVTYEWKLEGVGTDSVTNGITTAGNHDYRVVVDAKGCLDSMDITVVVSPLDTAIITNPPSLCASDAPAQLTLDLTKTTSGTWADSLGGNSYVTTGGVFDPAGIPDGKIMVVFTTDGTCPNSDTSYVTVTSQINFTLPDGDQTFCLNNNPDTVSINVNTGGGKFWTTSGEGISADSLYVVFSLYSAGQVDSLYYGKSGQCGDTVGIELTLLDVDVAEIDSLPEMCIDEDPITYTISGASTVGGAWSGPGVDAATGVFTPVAAGPGVHKIVYTTPGVCATADSVQITVKPRVDVSLDNTTLAFCGTAAAQTSTANLYGGVGVWQGSATWSGLGWDAGMTAPDSVLTFDPNGLTAGTDSIYYMIDENQFVCGDTVTLVVGISAMDVATIDSLPSVCSDGVPVQFTVDVASTPNGDWSGAGIDAAGLFDPVVAGPGTHKIKYKTPGVCWVEDSVHIVVLPKVTLSLTGDQAYCGNALPGVIDANQSGGVWFGNWSGALGYVNDSSQTFDPNLASVGIDSILYGIAGQCGDTTSIVIGIAPVDTADIDTNTAGPFCAADAATQLNLNPSTVGGIWSGGPYINAAGVFDPGAATIGGNTVTYTTQGVCPSVDNFDVQVVGQIIVDLQDAPVEVCNGDANVDLVALLKPITSATNGPWTVTPAKAGVIVGSNFVVTAADPVDYTVKYALYGGTATCADSDSIIIRVLPVLDPSVTAGPAADVCILDGTYNFVNTGDGAGAWSISGAGSIDAATGEMNLGSSGVGTFTVTYGFGGTCPIDSSTTITVAGPGDPTIQASGPHCENASSIQLVALGTQGGAWGGTSIDPVTGIFDPITAGDGIHTLTYDLAGACPIQGSIDVEVLPILDPTMGNLTTADLCISDGPYSFTSTGDANGVWTISNPGSINSSTGEVDLITSGVGAFTVNYGFGGTCPIDSSTTITIVGPGDPTISASGPFCENSGAQNLVASGTQGGVWSGDIVDPVTGVFSPELAEEGIHTITYSLGGGCPLSYSIDIEVLDVPEIILTATEPIGCSPHYTTIVDPTAATVTTNLWLFDSKLPGQFTEVGNFYQEFTTPGCYSGVLTTLRDNGCKDTTEFTDVVCVKPTPVADFKYSPDKPTVLDPVVEFTDLTDAADTWGWSFEGANPSRSALPDPLTIFPNADTGTYEVCLNVELDGCYDTICKNVFIYDNFTVYVPNAFTPDGDGLNDVFFPNGKGHDNIEVGDQYGFMIFNRWGELIWESGTPYQPWDATHQKTSKTVQEDVYVWKLVVWDNIEGVLKTYYGHVSVIK